jgi:hypothetical protein
MNKAFPFYMLFSFDDETSVVKAFGIDAEGAAKLPEDFDYEGIVDIIEEHRFEYEFGVHDACGEIGFTSYEVPKDRVDDLMDRWRTIFVDLVGEDHVTAVKTLTLPEPFTDDEVLRGCYEA